MPKTKNIRLTTPDAELQFSIAANTTGKQLLEQVTKTIALREIWYFGLSFTDSKGQKDWIKLSKKVIGGHDIRKQEPLELELKIKFYPEAAEDELILEITKRYFFYELKQAILNDEIYCEASICVLLASYACQVKYGDYDETVHVHLDIKKMLPPRVLDQHKLSAGEWSARIFGLWKEYQDMLKEDAMVEYIKIVQDLEMYGVSYFDIKNRKGTDLLLGVDALGLNIYEKSNKLTPKIGFPWSEIRNISFNDKKFIIQPIDKKAPDFVFFTDRLRSNKRILSLCMGNHEMYMRRRRDNDHDTIERQQMREQVREEMDAKRAEKEMKKKLRNEKLAVEEEKRRLAEERDELKLKQQEMEKDLLRKQQEKEESEKRERDLRVLQAEQQEKLKELDERRNQLEKDVILQRQEFAVRSAGDTERINEQLRQMQIEKDELERKIHLTEMDRKREKEHFEIREREHELELRRGRFSAPYSQMSVDEDIPSLSIDMVESSDIQNDKSEENRKAYTDHARLKLLREDLQKHQEDTKLTTNDTLQIQNMRQGRDKYKTLKQIRQGNTRQRVDLFEHA